MTDEPTDIAWDIPTKDVFAERTHVVAFPGQPHRVASRRVRSPWQFFWVGASAQEDYVPYQFGEASQNAEALAEVLGAVENLGERVARLSSEVRSVMKEVAELRADQEHRPTTSVATIHDLRRDDLSLNGPIQIVVEEYPEEVVARFPEVGASAAAESEFEAIELLKADIADLYLDLVATPRKKLGRVPLRWLEVLSQLVNR